MDLKPIILKTARELYSTANKHNMKSKFNYKKILDNLSSITNPIYSIKEIEDVKNIGAKTLKKFQEKIDEEVEIIVKKDLNLISLEKYKGIMSQELENKLLKIIENGETESEEIKEISVFRRHVEKEIADELEIVNFNPSNSKICRDDMKVSVKNYIPKYRTGAYAILRVLYKEDGLSKIKLSSKAQKFSDTEFDFNSKYSAWSSIRTLIKKNLVIKESKPLKYFLTEEGKKICENMFSNIDDTSIVSSGENEVVLLIDSREMKNKKDRSYFQRELEKIGVKTETRNLDVGDFLWIVKNNVEYVGNCIVERKKGTDFVSSVADGRFREQKKRLKEVGIKNIFYIVEGLKKQHLAKIGVNYGLACLTSTKMDDFILLETEDINETIKVLSFINQQILEKKVVFTEKYGSKNKENNEIIEYKDIIDSNVSINEIKMSYESFIDKGTKNSDLTTSELLYRSLLSIKGISHEKAKIISEKFGTFKLLYDSSLNENFIDLLSNIKIDGKALGNKMAMKVYNLFS